jgi:hypothetical protein
MILDMARKSYEETLQKGMAEKSREFEEKGAEIYSKAYNRHMASHRITETELFKLLKKQEARDGFEAAEISSRVGAVAGEVWPLLQQVSRSFPLYTLHDPEHSFRVAENMAKMIPKQTLNQLNSIEISVLLYAAYLYDIGMAASQDDLYAWLKSNDYEAFIAAHDNWESAIRSYERHRDKPEDEGTPAKTPDDLVLRQLQDVAYTDYLREKHAQRGSDFILARFGAKGQSDNKIQVQEVNYAEYVALVCKSHGDSATLLKGERFRRDAHVGKFPLNLQYCAVILRLADLADLDPERTPKVLLDFIMLDLRATDSEEGVVPQPRAKSAEEWAKHRAVLGYKITPDEIRLEAKCAIQRGLNEWCDYMDSERRDCRLIVHDNRQEITEKYALDLTKDVRKDFIESDGSYIYADFKFQLDYDRIVGLLMGTELWGDSAVVFRELLQNALDACYHRKALSEKLGLPYTPKVRFSTKHHWDGARDEAILLCEDNGTGMDQHIVENFLMRIGRSYYHSPEFRQQNLDFQPIGQFGLGVMSYFMLADSLRIDTQKFESTGAKKQPLSVEVNSAGRYVVLRPNDEPRDGTAVTLALDIRSRKHRWREDKYHDDFDHPLMVLDFASEILRTLAVHVDIPIEISHGDQEITVIEPQPFSIPEIDPNTIPCMQEDRFQEFVFTYDYKQTNGLAGTFRFLIPKNAEGKLCLLCWVESLFKMFIDPDGDLCLASPRYKDDRVDLDVNVSEDWGWSTDELRGVYRHKFDRKPEGDSYSSNEAFEVIKSHFRWSQNGLLVGKLEFQGKGHHRMRRQRKGDGDKEKGNEIADLFKHVPIPGLNAADIDLRGVWQVPLNVQRNDFQRGPLFQAFVERYYSLAAEMWKEILKQAGILDNLDAHKQFVDGVLKRGIWQMQTQLKKAINYEPEK